MLVHANILTVYVDELAGPPSMHRDPAEHIKELSTRIEEEEGGLFTFLGPSSSEGLSSERKKEKRRGMLHQYSLSP